MGRGPRGPARTAGGRRRRRPLAGPGRPEAGGAHRGGLAGPAGLQGRLRQACGYEGCQHPAGGLAGLGSGRGRPGLGPWQELEAVEGLEMGPKSGPGRGWEA